MFKLFFMLVAIATMISMGLIGEIGKFAPMAPIKAAPMMINQNGSLTFPGRMPSPNTVYDIRNAIQSEDIEKLNALLVENHLFVAPSY